MATPFELKTNYVPFLVHALGQLVANSMASLISDLYKARVVTPEAEEVSEVGSA